GSTGMWGVLAQKMTKPRQGAGVTWAPDPSDATKAYIYVFGGRDGASAAVTDWESLAISNVAGAQDTTAGFKAGSGALAAARWRLRAWTVTPYDTSLFGGTYVWVGGGSTTTNTMVPNIEGAQVQTGGGLTAFVAAGAMNA